MAGIAKDHTGKRFSMWTVLSRKNSNKKGSARWLCQCDCGNIKIVPAESLVAMKSKSCGCMTSQFRSASLTTHGHSTQPGRLPSGTYRSWHAMRQRCGNAKHKHYRDYGGRGIAVCERWTNFANFLADMGERPDNMTLDRINSNGNYELRNCKWSTANEQANNKRKRIKHSDIFILIGAAETIIRSQRADIDAEKQSLINALGAMGRDLSSILST